MARLENVAVDLIDFEDDRKEGGQGDLTTLAENIKKNGLLSPITLLYDGDRYKVIAGRRRLKCVRDMLKEKTIFATVYLKGEIDEDGASVSENLVRLEMDPVDTGVKLQKMIEGGKTKKEVALSLGIDERRVTHLLRLARLIPEWREAFHNKDIDIVMAARLAEFAPDMQKAVFDTAQGSGFSTWSISSAIAKNFGDTLTKFKCAKCENCVNRTRLNDATLFPDVQTIDDICLDHECYHKSWQAEIDAGWERFKEHLSTIFPDIDADKLPVFHTYYNLPGPGSAIPGQILLSGKYHEVKEFNKEYAGFGYDDESPFLIKDIEALHTREPGESKTEETERAKNFVNAVDDGNCGALWENGWVLRVFFEEETSEKMDEIEITARKVFSDLDDDTADRIVEECGKRSQWDRDSPLNRARRIAGEILAARLREEMETSDKARLVGTLIACHRVLNQDEMEEMFPGISQEEDEYLFMFNNIEKAPSVEELTKKIIMAKAVPYQDFPLEEDEEEYPMVKKLLECAGISLTVRDIIREAAKRAAEEPEEEE